MGEEVLNHNKHKRQKRGHNAKSSEAKRDGIVVAILLARMSPKVKAPKVRLSNSSPLNTYESVKYLGKDVEKPIVLPWGDFSAFEQDLLRLNFVMVGIKGHTINKDESSLANIEVGAALAKSVVLDVNRAPVTGTPVERKKILFSALHIMLLARCSSWLIWRRQLGSFTKRVIRS